MSWLKIPNEPGDYLWVAMWSCECGCVRDSGICFVSEHYGVNDSSDIVIVDKEKGKEYVLKFVKNKPFMYTDAAGVNTHDVDAYLKLDFPALMDFINNAKTEKEDNGSRSTQASS